jgi:myo-inositol catabolism protein IolS
MEYRRLGQSELRLSVVGLGCWLIGNSGWVRMDDRESVGIVRRALELGVNWLDTSEVYGDGHSERIIGKALEGLQRQDVIIATKVDPRHVTKEKLSRALDGSLERLGTDYVDLYQIHWPSSEYRYHSTVVDTPRSETMEALLAEQRSGRIRYIGVCNFDARQMADVLPHGRFESLQPPYNLYWRHIEHDDVPFCLAHGIGILAYSPLAQGLLAGRFTRETRPAPSDSRFQNKLFFSPTYDIALDGLETVREVAKRCGKSLSQTALRWVLQRPGVTAAIAGARILGQVEENIGACGWQLAEGDRRLLDQVGARVVSSLKDRNSTQWYVH